MAIVHRSSFISTLAIVALSACAVVSTAFHQVTTVCTWAFERACDFLKSATAKFEQPALRMVARPGELVQACAYALRLAKRERPQVRSQWRQCPSV